jgi:hypothetical protein
VTERGDDLDDHDIRLIAGDYIDEVYREITTENGSADTGVHPQLVERLCADPAMRRHLLAWDREFRQTEATMGAPAVVADDALYRTVIEFLHLNAERVQFHRASPGSSS